MKREVSQEARRLLNTAPVAYLCTADKKNQPHVVPVFFVFDPALCTIYLACSQSSKKLQNIRVHPHVSLAIDFRDPVNPLENKGVMVQGQAEIQSNMDLPMLPAESRLMRNFWYKYTQLKSQKAIGTSLDERVALVRVNVKKVAYWEGPTFASCPDFCVRDDQRSCNERVGSGGADAG